MLRLPLILLSLSLAAFATPAAEPVPAFAPPRFLGDTNQFGTGLARSMKLLATSTAAQRNTVRVLFYGQSITEQAWWRAVADDLRLRFPHANLVIENRAIGGFAAQLLVRMAETDLYPFHPDLLIFHVYGSHLEYENIIRRVRERTTADILMQTDHITQDAQLTEETDPAKLTPKDWNAFMNHSFLPGMARKYGAELCDQHTAWKQYLRDQGLSATNLLRDSVHLNPQGEFLMAEFVKPHLLYRADLASARDLDPWNNDRVRTGRPGAELIAREGKLVLDFEGNRLDVVVKPGATARATVLIDGKKPSAFPELYTQTRTTSWPGSIWPCLLRVTADQPRLVEEWTLTLLDASDDLKQFSFDVTGSITGRDGAGRSGERFVSQSGRVVIDPADWNFDYARQVFKTKLPPGFQIKWRVIPRFVDEVDVVATGDASVETVVTVADGLPNTRHQVEIRTDQPDSILAVRAYRPPLPSRAGAE